MVETERLLVHIAVKVERLYGNLSSSETPLQQAPEILYALSVYFAAHILFHMVYGFMDEPLL